VAARCEKAGERTGSEIPASAGSPPPSQLFYAAMGFSRRRGSAGGSGGVPRDLAGAPRVPSVGSGRSAQEDFSCVRPQWPGWDGWAQPAERNGRIAVRRGWQGVVIATTQASAAGAVRRRTAVFLGKNSSFSLGFPGRGLGFRKTKNPLPGGSGLRMRSLGAPQFFHFPCAAAARFVVVTWLICQEATACRRTKARGQPIWEAGADMVCSEQFMEFVIAGSVPAMCGR